MSVRLRYAPSPTGYLHVGGARTALYNFLYARKHGGTFVLRIEDTDVARSTEESIGQHIQDFGWLGIIWDEGPDPETLQDMGDLGPYRQSLRRAIYKEKADILLNSDRAYYCFLTEAELEEQRETAKKEGRPPQVKSPYAEWTLEQALEKRAQGDSAVIRFRTTGLKDDYVLQDLVRGQVVFPRDMVGDFVLLRADGMPVYNFCCAVDDGLMQISHVLRGEEHLPNTLRQMMIYEALGMALPQFGHLSLMLGEDRQKLSKRHGATSCEEFRSQGILPQALNNFIALMGWSSPDGREVLAPDELQELFDVDRLNPAAAVFDKTKLRWMNSVHLKQLRDNEVWEKLHPFLVDIDLPQQEAWRIKALEYLRPEMETLRDSAEKLRQLWVFKLTDEAKEVLLWETSRAVLEKWRELLSTTSGDSVDELWPGYQKEIQKAVGVKGKQLFMPLRVAMSGRPHGAEIPILVGLLPTPELLSRVNQVLGE